MTTTQEMPQPLTRSSNEILNRINELENKILFLQKEKDCAKEAGYIGYCRLMLDDLQVARNTLSWVLNNKTNESIFR